MALASLLFLKKKPVEVIHREAIGGSADYPIFMAVAEKVGFDRRGNTLYKRSPEGEELTREVEEVETVTLNGRKGGAHAAAQGEDRGRRPAEDRTALPRLPAGAPGAGGMNGEIDGRGGRRRSGGRAGPG